MKPSPYSLTILDKSKVLKVPRVHGKKNVRLRGPARADFNEKPENTSRLQSRNNSTCGPRNGAASSAPPKPENATTVRTERQQASEFHAYPIEKQRPNKGR